jgi:hypothetical protein
MSAPSPASLSASISHPNFALLYVDDALISARFYADIFEIQPIDALPTFALFALRSGLMLGLWAKSGVLPAVTGASGSSELAIALKSKQEFEHIYQNWLARGIVIAQAPTAMDFGLTFVALDPDGHRLRVFVPTEVLAAV